ncbi:MAG: hypothetical protein KTR33_00010 [Gammaproteobacteria bacterium]|nr:hypothetical protein [Gammaproteobacteria bacterium]
MRNLFTSLCLLVAMVPLPVFSRDVHIVVTGLGGDEEYTERFAQALNLLTSAYAPGSADETSTDDQPAVEVLALDAEQSSRQALIELFDSVAANTTADDFVSVTLIGHGTYDGEHYKFNVSGEDLTGADLKTGLQKLPAQRQLVVVATSASGVLLKTLEQAGRILVTATKSGGETNVVVFPVHWADALSTSAADRDRNEIVTVAEAFRYAETQVENHYAEQGLLASEHARLEGDNPAARSLVRIGALRNAAGNVKVEQLLDERLVLQQELDKLLARKADLARDQYYSELEQLMLRMARIQLSIDDETGWSQDQSNGRGS